MRACPKCHEAAVADDGYCGGRCREITMPSLAAPSGSASGLDMATEIRRLRDCFRRLEREICTNPSDEKLQQQMDIIAEALDETQNAELTDSSGQKA